MNAARHAYSMRTSMLRLNDMNEIILTVHDGRHVYKKTTGENFFIMEYCITYADILFRYLLDAGIEKQAAHALSEQSMLELAKWIEQNCVRKCS